MTNDYQRVAKVVKRGRATQLKTGAMAGVARRARLRASAPPAVRVKLEPLPRAASAGALRAGFAATPFGRCLIGVINEGLCVLTYPRRASERRAWDELRAEWPDARLVRNDRVAAAWAKKIFGRGASGCVLRVWVRGTAFQQRVWRAMLAIPHGRTASYGEVAAQAGYPRAHRAVGSAVGGNPISYLLPCHRVVRASGELGEYRWDPLRKAAMLAREAVSRP